jgi:hypothetical protein
LNALRLRVQLFPKAGLEKYLTNYLLEEFSCFFCRSTGEFATFMDSLAVAANCLQVVDLSDVC